MAAFRTGSVIEVLAQRPGLVKVAVEIAGAKVEAHGYPEMLGPVQAGDRVVVNTTGLELGLGTGGVGFVLWNLSGPGPADAERGHIVKLRYTPWQLNVLAAEEEGSPHRPGVTSLSSLEGMPVVACGLHSQVAAAAAGLRCARRGVRIGYLMSDGGALPLAWSELIEELRAAGLLDVTCTHGHAFGGDLEAVNVFSGLAALRTVGACDAVVAAMGPGVVGTASALGHTGLEQGQTLDAVHALDGVGVACLRVSFADPRTRHHGVSHHSLTALTIAARERSVVAVPRLEGEAGDMLRRQLDAAGIADRHDVEEADGGPALALLREVGVRPRSMGRTIDDAPEGFLAAGAAGAVAARRL